MICTRARMPGWSGPDPGGARLARGPGRTVKAVARGAAAVMFCKRFARMPAGKAARTPREPLALGLTFALACVSACLFLMLRCEGKGRMFGPRSRWRASAVIVLTSVLSTVAAYITVTAAHHLPQAILGLGVLVPSSLWLGEIRHGTAERRNVYRDAWTLWVTSLLARMHEGIAEDRMDWCEAHVDPHWEPDELVRAAHFYHDYREQRLSPEERLWGPAAVAAAQHRGAAGSRAVHRERRATGQG